MLQAAIAPQKKWLFTNGWGKERVHKPGQNPERTLSPPNKPAESLGLLPALPSTLTLRPATAALCFFQGGRVMAESRGEFSVWN